MKSKNSHDQQATETPKEVLLLREGRQRIPMSQSRVEHHGKLQVQASLVAVALPVEVPAVFQAEASAALAP